MVAAAHSFVASFPPFRTYSSVLAGFRAMAVFLAPEAAQRVGNVWIDRNPQVTGCDVFWWRWRGKLQYYSVSTTSAISIPYMYDHSCGDSLGLELLYYLLYAAACYVSRANGTSASVKRSVGADLDWHSRQLGEPKQHSAVGASVSTRTSPLWRRFIDFSVPIWAFNAFPRTNGESLVSGWSDSLDSITNHLAKLQFESPSVSESSDAGHDLLCCWYLQRSLHSPTGVPRIDRSSAPGWNRFLYTMAEDRETSYSAWWYSQVHTLHKGTCQLLLSHDWRFDWQLMCYTQLQQPHAVVVNRMAYEGEELQPSNYIRSANDNSRMVVVNLPKSVRH